MSNDLDARIKVGADTREAEAGIDRVNDKVSTMGETASKAGAKASTALEGMGKSSEAAAAKFTRSESAMGVAMRKTVEQMELAVRQGKSLADAFQIKAEIRGLDAAKFEPMLQSMRQLESQLAVVKAAEEDFAAQNAFAKKHQQATELNQAGQYTNWWAAELKKAEAAEAELGAQNAFANKHRQATELAKASQYTSWWAAELDKVDAAERKLAAENAFVNSLKSQSDAIGKTRADLLEMQAAQMGVTSQAAPFIAKLREAESGMGRMGASAGQTRAALAQLPMQFSDIVVSLQGGQAPLTVFLQQGAQIKDSFGGAGAALKAMAGYVVGLVNPYTVAAAAVAALGVAMAHAEDKMRSNMTLMAQLEATGRAGYLNSDAIKQLKKDMIDLPGVSKSMASAIIADLVQVRTLGGEALQKIALLSADFAAATGQDAAGAAKELAKAMEDPAKGARALDEAFNFLTVSQLLAIEAMVEAGDKAGAQGIVLDALGTRVQDLAEKRLTPLQGATKNFGDAWTDAMGRLDDKGVLNFANNALAGLIIKTGDLIGALSRIEIPESLKWLANLHPGLKLASMTAESLAATGAAAASKPANTGGVTGGWGENTQGVSGSFGAPPATGAKSEADATLAQLLKDTDGLKAKRDAAEDLGKTLARLQAQQKRLRDEGRGDSKEADELQARINGANEKIKALTKTRGDGSKKEQSAYAQLAASIQTKIDVNKEEFEFSGKLNEAQKAEIKLNSDLKEGKIKLSAAHEADLRKRIEEWKQQEKDQEQAKRNVAMFERQLDVEKQITEDYLKRSSALTSARLAMDAYEKAAQEDHERLQMEAGLIGMSNQARAIALAQYEAELELQRKIVEINKLDATQPQKEELRDRARVVAAKKTAMAERKVYVDEWEKTSQLVGDTLADYIMGGGKDAAQYLKRLFATLVLQPMVQTAVGGLMGVGTGAGAASGGGSALGTASSVQSLWSSFSGGLTGSLGSSIAGLGAQLGSTAATAFGSGIAAGGQLGLFGGGIGQGMSLIGSGAAGSTAAGLGTLAGAALPWVAGAAALYSIIKSFDDSGTPHSGMNARWSAKEGVYKSGEYGEFSALGLGQQWQSSQAKAVGDAVGGLAQTLGTSLDAFALAFGNKAGYVIETGFADDTSKDRAWGGLRIVEGSGSELVNWNSDRENKWAPRTFSDGEAGYQEYLDAVAVDVKAAFVAMDLPAWADELLKAATDIDTLSAALQQIGAVKAVFDGLGKTMGMFAGLTGDAQARLLAASGSIDALASNAGAFYESFYSEADRAQKQREQQMQALAGAGLYIDPYQGGAAKEMFRKTVEEAMSSGQVELAAKLMALSAPFGALADYGQGVLDDLAQAAKDTADAAQEAADKAKQAAAEALDVMAGLAQGFASQMTAAHSAMDTAGALWDRLDAAQGGSGAGYARIREQRLWDAMVQADYRQQIELAGQLTDMVLGRHQLEQANAQKLLDFGKSLRSYVDGLKIGALSPLTTGEKLAEAAKQYADTLTKAKAGDESAMGSLQGISSSYLDLARQYFASSGDYTRIFNGVTGSLDALGVSSQSEAQLQLDVSSQSLAQLQQLQGILVGAYGQAESEFAVEKDLLQRQVNELLRTADGIEAVRDLLGGMPAELAAQLNGGAGTGTGSFATLAQSYVSLLGGAGGSSTDPRYVASAMGHVNAANWQSELSNAMGLLTDPGARAQMQAIFDAVAKMKGIDGSHRNGLANVPYDGYVAQLHQNERVLTAEENRAYMPNWASYGRGSSNEALVAEIKGLRAEVSQLRKENREDSQMQVRANVGSNAANAAEVVNGFGRAAAVAAHAEKIQGSYK